MKDSIFKFRVSVSVACYYLSVFGACLIALCAVMQMIGGPKLSCSVFGKGCFVAGAFLFTLCPLICYLAKPSYDAIRKWEIENENKPDK